MLIGYARVSTEDQDLSLQRAALKAVGCLRIYEEKVSGAKRSRPELGRLLDQLRADDVVVVSRLDRLARSTRDLLEIAEQLKEAGAGLRSLHEPWANTTSAAGRMILTVFAGIAEFERELIQERTGSGRIAAKARGVRSQKSPRSSKSTEPRSIGLCLHNQAKALGCPAEPKWPLVTEDCWVYPWWRCCPSCKSAGWPSGR
jgi:DNA invertase Pin-like site-specific DNA recombinase